MTLDLPSNRQPGKPAGSDIPREIATPEMAPIFHLAIAFKNLVFFYCHNIVQCELSHYFYIGR